MSFYHLPASCGSLLDWCVWSTDVDIMLFKETWDFDDVNPRLASQRMFLGQNSDTRQIVFLLHSGCHSKIECGIVICGNCRQLPSIDIIIWNTHPVVTFQWPKMPGIRDANLQPPRRYMYSCCFVSGKPTGHPGKKYIYIYMYYPLKTLSTFMNSIYIYIYMCFQSWLVMIKQNCSYFAVESLNKCQTDEAWAGFLSPQSHT